MSTLAPAIGSDQAVVASLALRLVWVAAELAAAASSFPGLDVHQPTLAPPLDDRLRVTHDQHRRPGP